MKTQPTDTITVNIQEVNIVKVGKAKHDELTQKVESKADRAELVAVQEGLVAHQNTLTDHAERLDTKLDETQVKALIAEAELDDLTLEQVQQEVIRQIADKASTQAVTEVSQAQDAKIDTLTKQLEQKQAEVVELDWDEEALLVDQTNVAAWQNQSKRYLKIGDYYVPFFAKEPFRVKKEVFDVIVTQGEPKILAVDELIDFGGRYPSYFEFISSDERVTADYSSVTITTDEALVATITSRHLDKPITLNITVSETEE